MKKTIAIAGCGRLGTTLGKHLPEKGYDLVGISCRTENSLKSAYELLGTTTGSPSAWEVTRNADVVFITTTDGSIEATCREIAQNDGFKKDAIVVHCSGSLPSTILESARAGGAHIGSVHPLQSFASAKLSGSPFEGIIMAVEGDAQAVTFGRELAKNLGSVFIEILTDAKTLYHASAVVASNFLVTLIGFAFDLIGKAGIKEEDAMKVLKPLITGTLTNIENVGPVKALTGPVSRGDAETVISHLGEIRNQLPESADLYTVLGKYTVEMAKKRGELDEKKIAALLDALK